MWKIDAMQNALCISSHPIQSIEIGRHKITISGCYIRYG